ncbi:hypothetical protein I5G60_gp82 [Mycobacterium phage Saguaro]|uniref:Uncharacterized protein n=1 Tax=Mycobacterium phage Saguaro TaxID=2315616 RepID=A0A386KCP9_9CAUD|nr:hypothetical protein I5G60_gp82 [Mycobacterium phage Saguaro]AYD82074.1 hypothetical protein SEA_SAGUARO_82 [Mycobacterium phage Saguaro]
MPVISAAQLREEARKAREIADQLATAARDATAAEAAARRPKEPTPGDEPEYVVFRRYTSGREYHYAAVGWRIGNTVRWAVTGQETRRFNWAGLLEFIGETNWNSIRVVTDTLAVLPPGAEPPAAEYMGAFGKVKRTESVVEPLVRAEVPVDKHPSAFADYAGPYGG